MKSTSFRTTALGFAVGAALVSAYFIAFGLNPRPGSWGYSMLTLSLRPWTYAAAVLVRDNQRALLLAPVSGMLLNMGLLFAAGYWVATRARRRVVAHIKRERAE